MDEWYPVEVLRGVPGSMLLVSASRKWKLCCSLSFSSESYAEISPESLWEVCDPLAINHLWFLASSTKLNVYSLS